MATVNCYCETRVPSRRTYAFRGALHRSFAAKYAARDANIDYRMG